MIEVEFLKKIHEGIDEKSHIAITKHWDQENKWLEELDESYFYDRLFNEDEFFEKVREIIDEELEDSYFSINSFRKKRKDTDDVWHLNAIALDFDYYKINEYKDLTAVQMYEVLKSKLPLNPTSVVDSGRGLYIIYSFKHCSKHMVRTYQSIYKTFFKMFETYGMDPRAMNVTQIIRIPGSFNSNALAPVKVLELNDTNYKIQDFFELFPYTREEVALFKSKKLMNRETSSQQLTLGVEAQVDDGINEKRKKVALEFFEDFKKLIDIRNKNNILTGYRETLIFLVRRRCRWYGASLKEELTLAYEMNDLFDQPLDEKEVRIICKPRGNTKVPGIKWMLRNLGSNAEGISLEEQLKLNKLRSKALNDSLYQRKKRKIKLLNITTAERRQLERRTRVAKLKNEGLKNTHIADILEVNKSTITRDLNYINEYPWKFKKKLNEAMKELRAHINSDIFIRFTRYDEQIRLKEWLKYSMEMLN